MVKNHRKQYYKYKHKYLSRQIGAVKSSQDVSDLYHDIRGEKCCKREFDICYRKYDPGFKICKPRIPPLHCEAGKTLGSNIKEFDGEYGDIKLDKKTGEYVWIGLCCHTKNCKKLQAGYDMRYYGKVVGDTLKGRRDPLYNKQLENSKLQLDDTQKSEDLQLVEYLLSNIEPDVFGDAISSLRNDNTLDRIILHATREDAKLLSSKIKKMSNS